MTDEVRISHSEDETRELAAQIASELRPGDIVTLKGELGAGKSIFVRSILETLEVHEAITSPTFTLINSYENGKYQHFDLYRLAGDDRGEFELIGGDEILANSDSIKFLEWPEKLPHLSQIADLEITFEICPDLSRKISILRHGSKK